MTDYAQFIGRFHPLLVHLPVGILLAAIVLDGLSLRKRFEELKGAVPVLYLLGAIGAVGSCLTGYLLSTSGEYEGNTLEYHKWLGISVVVLSILFFLARQYQVLHSDNLRIISSLGLFLVLSITGHLGGNLTHGEDYLFVHAPEPIRQLAGYEAAEAVVIEDVQQAVIYSDIVVPLLKEKCYNCHSEKKQKGKLRIDSPEMIAAGGKSGVAIIEAHEPENSELIARLLLPLNDDKHMPPRKKDELTEEQIEILSWWIEHGASYDQKVADVEQSDEMRAILTQLESTNIEEEEKAVTFEVEPAPMAALEVLQDTRAVVLPIGENSNLLNINFVNVADANAALSLLEPLQEQIVWLRLSDSSVDDEGLTHIAQLPHLQTLYLDRTQVTDDGLAALSALEHLAYLNLVGTEVTATGIEQLKTAARLERLFIYQTNTSSEERRQLVADLMPIEVDTGGYIVPTLAKDTTLVSK
ncbi:MAG: c-type cytochrome domain-containing protein [Bacteroidota bacterium]